MKQQILHFTKYSLASVTSTLIDLAIFTFISSVVFQTVSSYSLFIATSIARICATLFNYIISKKLVFKSNISTKQSLIKYYIVAISKMLASWLLVLSLYNTLQINESIIKIPIDITLFFAGYILQKKWVFG